MSRYSCTRYATPELLAYWLGELNPDEEAQFEEHLFACDTCTDRLRNLVALGEGVRDELLAGNVSSVLVVPFIERLKDAGLQVREYAMGPGGSVNCTITPDDDLAVAHLAAPLRDVQRLDVLIYDDTSGERMRCRDIPFNASTNALVFLPSASILRTLGVTRQRFQLVAVDGVEERVIANYTFNHSPS